MKITNLVTSLAMCATHVKANHPPFNVTLQNSDRSTKEAFDICEYGCARTMRAFFLAAVRSTGYEDLLELAAPALACPVQSELCHMIYETC